MIVIAKHAQHSGRTEFLAIVAQPPSSSWRHDPPGYPVGEPANDNHASFGDWLVERHPGKVALASFILAVLVGASLTNLI